MIVTEEEARNKWCPFTRSGMHGVNTLGGINRAPELTRPDGFVPGATDCIGSKCMAWRWTQDGDGHFSKTQGFCGMAAQYGFLLDGWQP